MSDIKVMYISIDKLEKGEKLGGVKVKGKSNII